MKDKLFYYKNGNKMEPVVIPAEDVAAWEALCSKIRKAYPQDPHPYWEDVARFTKERADLKKQNQKVA